ncbi:MAG: iron-containing alcohol dehydrogenase [Thermoplasmatales archaeon]|nr:iron-containing alcohol dehydrogenase [Thermoplasmatales archaeon]
MSKGKKEQLAFLETHDDFLEFNLKTKMRFGAGISTDLGKYLKEFNLQRVGIIVDSAISKLPVVNEIFENLNKEGIKTIKWEYDLGFEPDYTSLDIARKQFVNDKNEPLVDGFVGIGGGSVMDFSKGLSTLTVNPGPAINYRGFPKDLKKPLPTIVMPTTAGTGSEATYMAVFINKEDKLKRGINTMYNFPLMAILDPKLTVSCPKPVTVSTGIDGLVHALESYVAVQSNYLTKIFARDAFKLLFNNLNKVLDNPKDVNVRGNLMLGSYLAGISLMNSGSGIGGVLSAPTSAHFGVPHGIAGGILLPYAIEFNVKNGYDYSELYDLIDGVDKSIDKKEKNKLFSKRIFELCRKLDIPTNFKDYGINKDNIDVLLKETEKREKGLAQNPIPFSVEDGKKLLLKIMEE